MKKYIFLLTAAALTVACSKEQTSGKPGAKDVESLSELTVDNSFDWSASVNGQLQVSMEADTNVFSFNGEQLEIVNEAGVVLERQIIQNNQATFYFSLPQNGSTYYVQYPNLDARQEITENGTLTFRARNFFNTDYATLLANATTSSNKKASNKTMANLIVNGDFESNSNFQTEGSNLNTGIWYVKQKDKNQYYRRTSVSGSTRFKSEHNNHGYAYQLVDVNGGDNYTLTANTSGDFCIYLFFYTSNGYYVGYRGYGPNSSNNINASNSIPNNADYVLVKVHGPDNDWIDNVSFDVTSPIQDADNDGVADADDAYPNDAARAYNSAFPTSGYQTVAFEDLWPYQGDYDFNDVVLSNQVNFVRNANNELVEATFTMSLDAVGSGYSNGLAMVLLNGSKSVINQNIIASVSGDATLDPDVTNGIIVFNDVFAAQSTYYQNNNQGPSATPDVFTFTITFNSNAGTQSLIPDTYIFRTADRGLEIHLPGYSGTAAANASYYNTGHDVNGTYRTANGLPWAIEIISADKSFDHPNEKVDITQAYPTFETWAQSEGSQATDWLLNKTSGLIFSLL
jgi:LruC domain-containing protein